MGSTRGLHRKENIMPKLVITRGPSQTTVRRADVPTFAAFAVKNRDGRLGVEYLHIGTNGRCYAVNSDTKELASSENRDKKVVLTGKWEFRTVHFDRLTQTRVARSMVRPGEIFVIDGKTTEYAAIGSVNKDRHGWLSVPMDRPQNHAIAESGDNRCTVVGTFTMRLTSSK